MAVAIGLPRGRRVGRGGRGDSMDARRCGGASGRDARGSGAPRSARVVLEARSRHGTVLGLLRVTVTYLQTPVPLEPPPPLGGDTTVGWGANNEAQVGAGFKSGRVITPTAGLLRGVRQAVSA